MVVDDTTPALKETMIELRNLSDAEFVAYLGDLDLRPATAEEMVLAWEELNRRRRAAEAELYANGAEFGLSREQVDEIRTTVHQVLGVKHEDEL